MRLIIRALKFAASRHCESQTLSFQYWNASRCNAESGSRPSRISRDYSEVNLAREGKSRVSREVLDIRNSLVAAYDRYAIADFGIGDPPLQARKSPSESSSMFVSQDVAKQVRNYQVLVNVSSFY